METTAEILRDGRLIESLRALVDRYVGERAGLEATEALATMTGRLVARIRLEEDKLFPAIEKLVGDPTFGPTARMRRQHAVLLDLVGGIEIAIRQENFAAAAGDLRELQAALRLHMEEERRVLLPIVGAQEHGHA